MEKHVLKIADMNVRGLGEVLKHRKVFNFFCQSEYEIIFLQETHSMEKDKELWVKQWAAGPIFFAHGTSNSRGVCVLFKEHSSLKVTPMEVDPEGRYLILEIETHEIQFNLINVYAPNTDEPSFFDLVFSLLAKCELVDNMIAGDFNLTLNTEIDRKGSSHNYVHMQKILHEHMQESGLCDPWRLIKPDKREFTWFRAKPKPLFARLDFFLCSQALLTRIEDVKHKPGLATDHSLVEMSITTNKPKRGRGFWKLNTKYLYDELYQKGMNKIISQSWSKHLAANVATRWEMLKCDITAFSVAYASAKAKNATERLTRLRDNISYLEHLLEIEYEDKIHKELTSVKAELELLMDEKTKTLMFLSKARWRQEGEKSSKFFFSLVK